MAPLTMTDLPHHSPRAPRHAAAPARVRRGRQRRRPGSLLLGGIGEVLITLGVLGLLFVVWELWWTGIEAESDRQETLEEFYTAAPLGDDVPVASGSESSGPSDFEACYVLEDGTEIGCAPLMAQAAADGQVMATLYAPRLGNGWAAPVREGVEAEQIDRGGVGRYTHTQLPDEPGNMALAGHRNTHASMLGRQDDLQIGDRLYLVSWDGMYTYQVSERQVVDPHQTEVLLPVPGEPETDPETGLLTLTTCHPMFSNAERLIHHAEIIDFTPLGGTAPTELSHHEPIHEMFSVSEVS